MVERLISLVQLTILARLLVPEDFGLYAMAMIVVTAFLVLISLGTDRVLIQRTQLDDGFIASLWLLELLRGGAVSLACLLSAPFYADWMGNTKVEPVLYMLALVPLLSSLRTPAQIVAERELQFRRVALFQGVNSLLQFLVLVLLAYLLRDVMALAWGYATMALLRSLLSWAWFGLPPAPRLNRAHWQELFSSGKHYFVIAIGGYVMTQGDNLLIGSYLEVALLGAYVLAYQISQWPVDLLNQVIGRVALPLFSRLQDDGERLCRAFDQVLRVQIALLIPFVIALLLMAPLLVGVLLGEKYQESVVLLQLLVPVVIGRGMSHLLVPLIIGSGHVHFASRIKLFETALFVVAICVGVKMWGVNGVALGAGAGYLFAAMARMIYVCRILVVPVVTVLEYTVQPVIASLGAGGVALAAILLISWGDLVKLIVAAAVYAVIYAVMSVMLDRNWLVRFRELATASSAAEEE